MKLVFLFVSLTAFVSCAPTKTIGLKGSYLNEPYEIVSENNKEFVWDKLIDLFAQKGLSIKIIDKSSGLIISEQSILPWSYEDSKGRLISKDAYVALPKVISKTNDKPIKPRQVTGGWNVRIKASENGKAIINVNLVNIKAIQQAANGYLPEIILEGAVSTGVFERALAALIK